ncbi:MAG: hypothetical protein EP300_13830, partial [Gammaproteobacteria bacterium]
MNKNLLFTVILALLSFAVYQPVSAAASVELVPSSRVILKTTSDMTVDEIIKRVYPNDKDLWPQIKAKLIETNPNSFVQYSDRLIPGTRLKLVDIKRIYDQPEELSLKVRVGYVARLEGRVIARDVNNGVQQLQINSQVFEGDRIETEVGSRIQILMDDGAEVYLKEDSVLKISEYVITDGYGK